MLFAGVSVSTFQPGNFTGWGSEGVKLALSTYMPLPFKTDLLFSVKQPEMLQKKSRLWTRRGLCWFWSAGHASITAGTGSKAERSSALICSKKANRSFKF